MRLIIKNRKPNRLKGYDYSQDGYYFVTICIKNRMEFFGEILNGKMFLNKNGEIVKKRWFDLPNHFWNCRLDEFVIMPNHIHGIIVIDNESSAVGTGLKPVPTIVHTMDNKKYSLSEIIRGFKTFSSRQINYCNHNILFRWQRSFYDHIICNDESLFNIREYIRNNPLRWDLDRNNPENLLI